MKQTAYSDLLSGLPLPEQVPCSTSNQIALLNDFNCASLNFKILNAKCVCSVYSTQPEPLADPLANNSGYQESINVTFCSNHGFRNNG